MKRANVLAVVSIFSILLSACSYELSDIPFSSVEKTSVSAKPDISFSINRDSIDLFESTDLNVSAIRNNLILNKLELEYLNSILAFDKSEIGSKKITFNSSNTPAGWFRVFARLFYGTNSGSIADKVGVENLIFEKSIYIRYIHNPESYLSFKNRINCDSVVELYWVKPRYSNITATVLNATTSIIKGDTVCYLAKDYVNGSVSFTLNALLSPTVSTSLSTTVNYALPTLKTEKVGSDSCRVYGIGTLKRNFYITVGTESKYIVNQCSFSYTSALPALNQTKIFRVEYLPVGTEDPNKVVGYQASYGFTNR